MSVLLPMRFPHILSFKSNFPDNRHFVLYLEVISLTKRFIDANTSRRNTSALSSISLISSGSVMISTGLDCFGFSSLGSFGIFSFAGFSFTGRSRRFFLRLTRLFFFCFLKRLRLFCFFYSCFLRFTLLEPVFQLYKSFGRLSGLLFL